MGLLAVDVTAHGVVMSADSQPVEIRAGDNRVDSSADRRTRNPIVVRAAGGFVGLVGFAGTEHVEGIPTARWLRRFDQQSPNDDVGTFCRRLADALTNVWQSERLDSVLEILVTGEISGDVQFWYVRNSQGLRDSDWRHHAPTRTFKTANDLDAKIRRDGQPGESKENVLGRITYSFRQGVLLPGAPVFSAFSELLRTMWIGNVEGFAPLASLDDVGQYACVRMEFLKRLCSEKHGIFAKGVPSPVGGDVHVYGVGRDGRVCIYHKLRNQVETFRPGRP
jgi:hypothetical protein